MCLSSLKVRSDFFYCKVKTRKRRARINLQETRDFLLNDEQDNNQSHLFTSSTLNAQK